MYKLKGLNFFFFLKPQKHVLNTESQLRFSLIKNVLTLYVCCQGYIFFRSSMTNRRKWIATRKNWTIFSKFNSGINK